MEYKTLVLSNKTFKKHIPAHLYLDNQIYFVTSRTRDSIKYFNTKEKIKILKSRISQSLEEFQYQIFAWVIIENHYHLLFRLIDGKDLPAFIQFINGGSSYILNKLDGIQDRQIWWNYWDYCIRNESDFYKHFNYIHNNPIKHGYIENFENLSKYEFSSYLEYLNKFGSAWLSDCFVQYPITDFSINND